MQSMRRSACARDGRRDTDCPTRCARLRVQEQLAGKTTQMPRQAFIGAHSSNIATDIFRMNRLSAGPIGR